MNYFIYFIEIFQYFGALNAYFVYLQINIHNKYK